MVEQIIGKVVLLGQWSYLLLFLTAFLESSAFIGLVVPGETVVVIAGFLSYNGYLNTWDCVLLAAGGAVMGDSMGYLLGSRVWRNYYRTHRKILFIREAYVEKTYAYFRRHGVSTVFFGRFISVLRLFVPMVAGMSEMPYGRFLFYNASGGILWSFTFVSLGFFFGESWQLAERWAGRVGVFVLFILIVVAVFLYFYGKIIKRKARYYAWFRARGARINSHPYVAGFKERHPEFVSLLVKRLSPGGYLGLHLTIGLTLSCVFMLIFGLMLKGLFNSYLLGETDPWLAGTIQYFNIAPVTSFMEYVSFLSGRSMVLAAGVLITPYFLAKRRYSFIAGYFTSVGGGIILIVMINAAVNWMLLAARPRHMWNVAWSFPGEHSVMSVVSFGILSYFVVREIRSWKGRVMAGTVAVFLVLLTGMSSVYLRLSHISEILAGYAGGLFWLSICITGLEVHRRKARSMRRAEKKQKK